MAKIPRHGRAENEPRFTIVVDGVGREAKHPGEDLALMEALNVALQPKDRPPVRVEVADETLVLYAVEKDAEGNVTITTRP